MIEHYANDPTKPAVLTSFLPESQTWYVSLHRYQGSYASNREIVLTAQDANLEAALKNAASRFLIHIGKGPVKAIDELNKLCFGEQK